ncbi:hypothetical protein SISNIDRAFT_456745 [Sistotremastrum niveocremeum HHB9708]|uniref:Cation/H+ exchanger transmembrane domain-containing protein n=1 Tax=Sistotremastrum niveocremeum HHB9708 TaxID=1314777 RepID=A0A164SIM9_9AGAM|nr:hypothetical protein SISNIDRAFT_456745 [Sistotremastrum niveocremeum HHB9708]
MTSMHLKSSLFHIFSREAEDQGGLLSGKDPTVFNPKDPLRLWIIQVGIIVGMAQLLSLLLKKLRQPKVIAEVIGGIILGPTAMGRIPGFTQHIFPAISIPYLSLVANIGLVLFLFLVGLEIDIQSIRKNARQSITISLGGILLPFGIGAGMSKAIYEKFVVPVTPGTSFGHFMLFTCVAYSITAFPVLCRILTELKLLDTTVGICVLSAGVGNDIVGWTLLALSVALVNAGSGLTALYILLCCIGWTIFLLFPVKKLLYILARRTGSIESGPTMFFMTVSMLVVFGSAFFTDAIGVHAIFGGFLAGLIIPRENGLAIALTEKLEDMVTIIFLPLYFTLSGLSTNLGLLDTGLIWGYTIGIIATAWFGKFFGASIAARFAGFKSREAATIGTLMSCKGLVELIVLNVGLDAGILSQRVFSMFVLEALTLTFFTTPVVVSIYPPNRRVRITSGPAKSALSPPDTAVMSETTLESGPGLMSKPSTDKSESLSSEDHAASDRYKEVERRNHFMVVLDKIEHLSGIMMITQLIRPGPRYVPPAAGATNPRSLEQVTSTIMEEDIASRPMDPQNDDTLHTSFGQEVTSPAYTAKPPAPPQFLSALRLIELSDRTSAVMKSTILASSSSIDPLLGIFRTFAELNGMKVNRSGVAVRSLEDWSESVVEYAEDRSEEIPGGSGQLVFVNWIPPAAIVQPPTPPAGVVVPGGTPTPNIPNPFEGLFKSSDTSAGAGAESTEKTSSSSNVHSYFARSLFNKAHDVDVALVIPPLISSSFSQPSNSIGGISEKPLIFFPFIGGPDDRSALEFVGQICSNGRSVKARVIRIIREEADGAGSGEGGDEHQDTIASVFAAQGLTVGSTMYGAPGTATRLQSQTADNMIWEKYTNLTKSAPLSNSITLSTLHTSTPLRSIISQLDTLQHSLSGSLEQILIVLGRSRRMAVESHHSELKHLLEEYSYGSGSGNASVAQEVRKTVGDVASSVLLSRSGAGMVVIQAGSSGGE